MSYDADKDEALKALLQTQLEHETVPDFLEAKIMDKITAAPEKQGFVISLQSVFILSTLLAIYILLTVLSSYYYPKLESLKDFRLMLPPIILAKLCYDLNEVLPQLVSRLPFLRKPEHS